MVKVLVKFSKGGKSYKKGDTATFKPFDEKRLIQEGFCEDFTENKKLKTKIEKK